MSPRLAPALAGIAAAMLAAAWIANAEPGAARAPSAMAVSQQRSASLMDLEQAYAEAERLVGSRRHIESLPYFERLIALVPSDDWALRHDYSNALQGASLQGRAVLGLSIRATRSSLESIALMRRALAEMDRAQALARSPRAAATVHLSRARQLGAWGFPWDAWSEARAAAAADPTWTRAALAARQWTLRLEGELRDPSPGLDDAPAPERARPKERR